jgi:hypothetical protein
MGVVARGSIRRQAAEIEPVDDRVARSAEDRRDFVKDVRWKRHEQAGLGNHLDCFV